jgi:hypothetical protein
MGDVMHGEMTCHVCERAEHCVCDAMEKWKGSHMGYNGSHWT